MNPLDYSNSSANNRFIDRESGNLIIEDIKVSKLFSFLYKTWSGNILRDYLTKSVMLHRGIHRFFSSKLSTILIKRFIEETHINIDEVSKPLDEFHSFNDFFSRQLKPNSRPIEKSNDVLVSPADGKILLTQHRFMLQSYHVKGINFTLSELLQRSPRHLERYDGGDVAILRLYLPDYHRFHFPYEGAIKEHYRIPGKYFSVSPFPGNNIDFYTQNSRTVTSIDTKYNGLVTIVAVGGFLISSIQQEHNNLLPNSIVRKGDEAGFFEFGGSTLVLLTEPNKFRYDSDILENSSNGIETYVKFGSRIAISESKTIPSKVLV